MLLSPQEWLRDATNHASYSSTSSSLPSFFPSNPRLFSSRVVLNWWERTPLGLHCLLLHIRSERLLIQTLSKCEVNWMAAQAWWAGDSWHCRCLGLWLQWLPRCFPHVQIEEGFGTREVIKNVNLILEESVDDILSVIDQEVNEEQKTFWENLRDFLELPTASNNSNANFETSDFYDFEGEDGKISEQLEDVLQRRQELQDLAAIAAVMGYPVLGPP